jgi:8-oxo-dGTP pyrophosphatase MutT (NUDIX family)
VLRTIRRELAGYEGRNAVESADLARVRSLLIEDDPWQRALPLHVTASALIVHPPSRRVLLRWHARQKAWLQVGGHADPGETDPVAIALREGREEAGLADLRPWPSASILHVVMVSVPAAPHEPAHEHADVRYVLATDTPDDAAPESPAAQLRWLTLTEAHALTTEDNLRETLSRIEALFAD